MLRYRRRLAALAARHRADVVHTHGFKMHVLGALAAPKGACVVWHLHDYITTRAVSVRLLQQLSGRCTVAVANSRSIAADAAHAFGSSVRIETIYNAVDLTRFHPVGPALDLDALAHVDAAPSGTVRVGLLATFGRWKGHRTFFEAVAALPPELPLRAYVIGGPMYQTEGSQETLEALRSAAAELRIAQRVVFTGPVEDSAPALRALDILVHASTRPEPFGMVIAEGMACGRAVIGSRNGGAAELIEEDVDGIGHSSGNAEELAACIRALVFDARRRVRLGRAARATAERRFDRGRLGVELTPLYATRQAA